MRNKKLYSATASCLWMVCIVFIAIICMVINSNVVFAEESTINIAESNSLLTTTQDRDYLEVFSNNGDIEKVDNIQTHDILVQDELLVSNTVQNFTEHKLLDSGRPDSSSFVITIMGDGFTESEQDIFLEKAQAAVNDIFGDESSGIEGIIPFNQFKDIFTVYAIEVVSNESGVSLDISQSEYGNVNLNDYIVDNYFGSSFYHGQSQASVPIERALVVTKENKVEELKKPNSALEIVICNSSRYGATGGSVAVVSLSLSMSRTIVHEIGHTIAGLADEYYYPSDGDFSGREAPNMTQTNNLQQIKWKRFVGVAGIGAVPLSHGVDRNENGFDNKADNWFKPSESCTMLNSNKPFCLVCKYNMLLTFAAIMGNEFDYSRLVTTTFDDFGYEGELFSWKGIVKMINFDDGYSKIENNILIVRDSILSFEVSTKSKYNYLGDINGQLTFNLTDSSENVLQTNNCSVNVNWVNNVTFSGTTFNIDTSQLPTGVYTLNMTSDFNREGSSEQNTASYMFAVNRPFTVMDGFGYNESLYKWNGKVTLSSDYLYMFNDPDMLTIMGDIPINFEISTVSAFNAWTEISGTVTLTLTDSAGNVVPLNGNNSHVSTVRVGLLSNASITNSVLSFSSSGLADGTYTLTLNCSMTRSGTTYNTSDTFSFKVHNEMCVSEGTLITLADGSQKAVEDLTGNEELLVWNMFTGDFDSAPVLFIDSDEQRFYQIVNLYFSDGTSVKVIGEHAFWNKDLNEYVFLRTDADQYIGDAFVKQTINENGEMVSSEAILTDVVVTTEYTTAWSPVTYGHLCYYVNGVLSMPGATEGLINIFDVDPDTMRYDDEAMNQDIATYGLFTYEEFNALIPVSEEIFNAFNGQYLKVAIGKGLTSLNELAMLIEKYEMLF